MGRRGERRRGEGSALAAVSIALGVTAALLGALAVATFVTFRQVVMPELPQPARPATPPLALDPGRPTIALLLSPSRTEISDLLVPYAIFHDATLAAPRDATRNETLAGSRDAARAFDVVVVSPTPGPVLVNGNLWVVPHLTLDTLPRPPRVVVVPALHDAERPDVQRWLRSLAAERTLVVSICEGARAVAAAGLLDGHAATSHWSALASLAERHPSVRWQRGVRFVEDGERVSSAGVTTGFDAALHTVARLAGPDASRRVAEALGYAPAPPGRPEPELGLGARDALTGLANAAFRWPKRRLVVSIANGVDELALAAPLDAWPRTFAFRTETRAETDGLVVSRRGLWLLPSLAAADAPDHAEALALGPAGAAAYPQALRSIGARLGAASEALVALQLEMRPEGFAAAARPDAAPRPAPAGSAGRAPASASAPAPAAAAAPAPPPNPSGSRSGGGRASGRPRAPAA